MEKFNCRKCLNSSTPIIRNNTPPTADFAWIGACVPCKIEDNWEGKYGNNSIPNIKANNRNATAVDQVEMGY